MTYTLHQSTGIAILVAAGALSLVCVLGALSVFAISAYRSLRDPEGNPFTRTHVAGYFLSLLFCGFLQAIGALLNIRWLTIGGVRTGSHCTSQGAIKQIADVGTALWSLVIAVHTFNLLFRRHEASNIVFYCTIVGVWALLGTVVLIGPAALMNPTHGPFYGISGYWCWITPKYPVARYALEYAFMLLSAGISFILYLLIFLRLRGNIAVTGWRIRFRSVSTGGAWQHNRPESKMMQIAKQQMWYPIGYIVLILPIAASRFSEWAGKPVPFEVTIFSATVFMLSGVVNAVLFVITRRVIPKDLIVPFFMRSRRVIPEDSIVPFFIRSRTGTDPPPGINSTTTTTTSKEGDTISIHSNASSNATLLESTIGRPMQSRAKSPNFN